MSPTNHRRYAEAHLGLAKPRVTRAMRTSHAMASSLPPPKAKPFDGGDGGDGKRFYAGEEVLAEGRKLGRFFICGFSISAMSAPPTNALAPHPVKMRTGGKSFSRASSADRQLAQDTRVERVQDSGLLMVKMAASASAVTSIISYDKGRASLVSHVGLSSVLYVITQPRPGKACQPPRTPDKRCTVPRRISLSTPISSLDHVSKLCSTQPP